MGTKRNILTVNAGSSSVKLVLFSNDPQRQVFAAEATNIGQPNAALKIVTQHKDVENIKLNVASQMEAAEAILDRMADKITDLDGVGHRIVHGGPYFSKPVVVTQEVIDKLRGLSTFDPEHLPVEIELVKFFTERFASIPQIACFDTAFYQNMPDVAKLLPLPRKFEKLGLRRYGFHGLSYEYVLRNFKEVAGEESAHGRVVLAHLGGGASLTAVKDGKPLDTTMSFTPASGIPMSTRTGDLDPGIVAFLHQQASMTVDEFNHMVNFESGLLGVSDTSADMELLIREYADNQHAAEAVDLFCYQVRKTIGSFAAVLGGLDSLVFTGGMGENAPVIREKVCQSLGYLDISLDKQRNQNHEFLISRDESRVGVHVMRTDEAAVIAAQTRQVIEKEG